MNYVLSKESISDTFAAVRFPAIEQAFLFISQSVDWIEIRSARRRIESTQRASGQANHRRSQCPPSAKLKYQARGLMDSETSQRRERKTNDHAQEANQQCLTFDLADNVPARSSHRLQNANFACALGDGRVHRQHDDERTNHGSQANEDI